MAKPFKSISDFLAEEEAASSTTSLSDIFEEEVVSLDTFIKDKKFLGLSNVNLSPIQSHAIQVIERVLYPDIYPRMAEEFESGEYWAQEIPMRNLITFQYGKGCLVDSEEIYDSESGQWRVISEIDSSFKVMSTDERNIDGSTHHSPGQSAFQKGKTLESTFSSQPFKRGHGRCVRVTTRAGNTIDVYEGHLFVSWKTNDLPFKNRYKKAEPVWSFAGSLKPGDRIAVASRVSIESPVPIDPREAELLGYWIGDGCMPSDKARNLHFAVDSNNTELIDRYTDLVESYPGMGIKTTVMKSGALGLVARKISGRSSDGFPQYYQPLLDIVKNYGLWGSRAATKRVPKQIFSLPDDQLAIFLSALWDTDGTLYLKKSEGRKTKTPVMSYCSVSEGLIRDIQKLLLRFGVQSRIRSKRAFYTYKGEKREGQRAWILSVARGEHIQKLCSILKLHGNREAIRQSLTDWKYSNSQMSSEGDIYWDKVASVEEIGDRDYWDVNVPEGGGYVAGSGLFSSNSGKDMICRWGSLRVAYILLCLKNPQEYFGLPAIDSIHLLNVARNSTQARTAFFEPMKRAVKQGWFRDKAHPTQNSIVYDKGVEAVSGHSEAESQEGMNILLGVLDEIDAFKSRDELVGSGNKAREASTTAEAILDMVKSSAASRFPETYKRVAISYPRYLGSTIQKLTEEGRASNEKYGDKSIHYVSGPYATWEVNPRIKGREDFQEEYDTDPDGAAAKYECKPKRATNPFFKNMSMFKLSVDRETMPITIDYRITQYYSKHTHRMMEDWEPVFHFSPDFKPVQGAIYAMHADLAIKGDRAGVALSHVEKWEEYDYTSYSEDGTEVKGTQIRPTVRNDFTFGFEAAADAKDEKGNPLPREIKIRWVRMLAYELIKRGFRIGSFSADSFQSFDTFQILEHEGIDTDRRSTDRDPSIYGAVKDIASESRLHMPFDQLLMNELEGLSRLDNGKIDHPPSGSKDLSDAFACSIVGALECGGEEAPEGSIVEIGAERFEVGEAFVPPIGMDDITGIIGNPYGLPIGFESLDGYGR